MTGKEALKLAQDTILAHNGNNKSSFTMKNLYLVEKELDKYKRAFEILKDKLDIKILCENSFICNGAGYYRGLTLEEYELLEELIKQ